MGLVKEEGAKSERVRGHVKRGSVKKLAKEGEELKRSESKSGKTIKTVK